MVTRKLNSVMVRPFVAFRYQMKRIKLVISGSYHVEFSEALAKMLGYTAGVKYQARSTPYTVEMDRSSANAEVRPKNSAEC